MLSRNSRTTLIEWTEWKDRSDPLEDRVGEPRGGQSSMPVGGESRVGLDEFRLLGMEGAEPLLLLEFGAESSRDRLAERKWGHSLSPDS